MRHLANAPNARIINNYASYAHIDNHSPLAFVSLDQRGYYTVYFTWYMIFNTCLNLCFLIDTFLSFFRAYRDEHGRMVFSLRSIRRHYIRSGWFFVNLLASIPASSLVYGEAKEAMDSGDTQPLDNPNMRLYFILELFKLLRLLRIKKISESPSSRFVASLPLQERSCYVPILSAQ